MEEPSLLLLLLIDLAVLLPLEISIMGARAPPPSAPANALKTLNYSAFCGLRFALHVPLHSRLAGWMPLQRAHSLLRRLCSKKVTGFIC